MTTASRMCSTRVAFIAASVAITRSCALPLRSGLCQMFGWKPTGPRGRVVPLRARGDVGRIAGLCSVLLNVLADLLFGHTGPDVLSCRPQVCYSSS